MSASVRAFFWLSSGQATEGTIAARYSASYDAIRLRAPQIAGVMDDFLAAHGGLAWNPGTFTYNFSTAQSKALHPVEDINSTRRFCTAPTINIQQTLANIARLFWVYGQKSGEIATVRREILDIIDRVRKEESEGKDKGGSK